MTFVSYLQLKNYFYIHFLIQHLMLFPIKRTYKSHPCNRHVEELCSQKSDSGDRITW